MPNAAALAGVPEPASLAARPAATKVRRVITVVLVCAALTFFITAGLLFAPLLGLQTDEVMFAKSWWDPTGCVSWLSIYHHRFPLMMMSYLGGLKSWLYAPLLALLPMSVWLIRVPVILATAVCILLAGRLTYRIASYGQPVAVACFAAVSLICLLATDDTILVTAVFDWGPVVLQNLLLVITLLFLEKFHRENRLSVLFWAGVAIGLALWNKALFIWNLSAMIIAAFVFGLPVLRRLWSLKRFAVLCTAVILGALPLVRFNLGHRGNTLGDNGHSDDYASIRLKAVQTARYLNGLSTQSALVDMELKAPDQLHRPLEGSAVAVWNNTGRHFSSWVGWAACAFLVPGLLLARGGQRRWIAFFLLSTVIGWFECILTRNAGMSIHHAALFFFPWFFAVALSISAMSSVGRWIMPVLALCLLFFCSRSILAGAVCYADMLTYEPHLPWTNADHALASDLARSGVTHAIATDWGISDVVSTWSRGRIKVNMQAFALAGGDWFEPHDYLNCTAPSCVIISHVAPRFSFPQADAFLNTSLKKFNLVRTDEKIYSDTHDVPAFLCFRVRPAR